MPETADKTSTDRSAAVATDLAKTAKASKGNNPTRRKSSDCGPQRILIAPFIVTVSCSGPNVRTARLARDRLRVKPPVPRQLVFGTAIRAERELPHRCIHTLERHRACHAISRPALSTTCKRESIAAVIGARDLPRTIRAETAIHRNPRGQRSGGRNFDNMKSVAMAWR